MSTGLRFQLAGIVTLVLLLLTCAHSTPAQSMAEAVSAVSTFPDCKDLSDFHQFSICELTIKKVPYNEKNAYLIPDVKTVFTNSNSPGNPLTVHGFYDKVAGEIVFKVRFNASAPGTWTYHTSCTIQNQTTPCDAATNSPFNLELNKASGSLTVKSWSDNGFLRNDANSATNSRFVYDSAFHPFIWGQTYYQIIDNTRSNWQNAVTKSNMKGLNKFRMLLYPWWDYGHGDSQPFLGNPTTPDHDSLRIEHWQKFDEIINYLYNTYDAEGSRMLAELILFKDPAKDPVTKAVIDGRRTFGDALQDDRYLKYAVARYGAFPNVTWCFSNEWQGTGKDKAYWDARAKTLVGVQGDSSQPAFDPWMYANNAAGLRQQRATSIHPRNELRFSFFDRLWLSHDVLQFSIGHPDCSPSCQFPDEWASSSIKNNLPDNRPVTNDEYGYVNSAKDKDCNAVFSSAEQRRGMWAIAVSGGYGTFGDGTGECASPKMTSPSVSADWVPHDTVADSAYADTLALANYFKSALAGIWWKMKPNPNRVGQPTDTMRAYALEGATPRQYVIYAVNSLSAPSTVGKFTVNNLPKGTYTTTFYDPRALASPTPTSTPTPMTRIIRHANTQTLFATPTYDDWVLRIAPKTSFGSEPDETVWVADDVPAGASTTGDYENWNWVDSDPTPIGDSLSHQSNIVTGLHQHYFYGATDTFTINAGDVLFAYVYLDPASPPSQVMLQWNDGQWAHRAYWAASPSSSGIPFGAEGTDSRRYMGPLPAPGQWARLEVPAAQVGLEGHTLNGMAFTLYDGRATWDDAGKVNSNIAPPPPPTPTPTPLPTPTATPTPTPAPTPQTPAPPASDVVWVEDNLPAGATPYGYNENWNWTNYNPGPVSGFYAHQSAVIYNDVHQHYFLGATNTLTVDAGDKLVAYVYLDPANPPRQVMLQWNDGTWEHRAYWGESLLVWGTEGTDSRRYMGPLPAPGQWARLEVPAAQVGLEGHTLNGMAFTLYDGRATWDHAGKLPSTTGRSNVALAAKGSVAFASSTTSEAEGMGVFPASNTINGDRSGVNWGSTGGWRDGSDTYPDWLEVDFPGNRTINEIDLFTLQDNYTSPVEPTETMTFTYYGVTDFDVQFWNGTQWLTVPGGSVNGNNKVWRRFNFSPIKTNKVRVLVRGSLTTRSRIVELEAWQPNSLNVALGKPTAQSSTYNVAPPGAPSSLAVDGNPNGNYFANSVTSTNYDYQAWWQVDLGASYAIDRINLWNRTDCCPERLSNVYVFVSDDPFISTDPLSTRYQPGVSAYYVAGQAGTPSTVSIGRLGRYVRVQLAGTNYLSLAEVEVFGVSVPTASETVWVEDGLPAGAVALADNESWNWISANPSPVSGSYAHQSGLVAGTHQHYFYGAANTLNVNAGDVLFAYVYLDPASPPSQVMLQWNDGTWEHRAYWAATAGSGGIQAGAEGTNSRRYMGPLPAPGQWMRLEVPAAQVGLEGHTLNGMAFTLYDGRATWDHAGKTP
jgi:hypothetical protein